MLNPQRKLALAASLGNGIASFATGASALPVFDALAIRNAAPPTVEEVQWRWGWGWGAPVAAGVVAGSVVGSALAAPYYGYGPYYYPGPYYPGPPPAYYWLSSAGAWLSSASAWLCRRTGRRFRWRPSGLLQAALSVIQPANRNLSRDRRPTSSLPLNASSSCAAGRSRSARRNSSALNARARCRARDRARVPTLARRHFDDDTWNGN